MKKFEAFAALVLESLVCVGSSSSFFFFWFIYLLNLKYIPHNLMQCMSLCLSAWLINKMLTKWNGYIYIYRHSCVREREREHPIEEKQKESWL